MKTRKIIVAALIVLLFLSFFSCETVTPLLDRLAPGIVQGISQGLQGLGVPPNIADSLARSGVDIGAELARNSFEEITPEGEYYLGRAVAANILTRYSLQTNTPALTAYLNRICHALVVNSLRPEIFNGYRVAILDTDEINAFATPGGHIFLTRGLIDSATSEDTLAAVIAHEIAHIQLAHGFAAIKQSRVNQAFAQAAFDVGTAATDIDLTRVAETFGLSVDVVVNAMLNGYSREQEFEADSVAMSLLALAGYNPSALIDVLRMLERNQPGRRGGFNNTHPTPAQRITNAQRTVGNYEVEDTNSYRVARYRAVR